MSIENKTKKPARPLDEPVLGWMCVLSMIFGLLYGCLWLLAPSVKVEWTTKSEVDTVGYNLLRSVDEDEGYTQINATLIPVSGDSLGGGKYVYIDRKIKAGVQYYYMLEDVNSDGTRSRNGPILVQQVGLAELVMAVCLFLAGVTGLWILSIRRRLAGREQARGSVLAR